MTVKEAYKTWLARTGLGPFELVEEAFSAGWEAALEALENAVASPYDTVLRGDLEVAIFNLRDSSV